MGVTRRHPVPVRIRPPGRGLGALLNSHGECPATDSGPALHRDQEVLQRSGELHARQPVRVGRGAGAAELLYRRGLQLGRHRVGRRRRPGTGRVGRDRRADQRSDGGRPTPVRQLPRQPAVAARQGRRDPRPALRAAVAQPGAGDGSSLPPLPRLRPTDGRWRVVRLEDGLGAGQRLRTSWDRADAGLHLGQAQLAALVGRRAAGHPRERRAVRPDLLRQAAHHRSGRRARPAVVVQRRRRRAAGPGRLHRHAQRPGRLRGRRDRHQAAPRPVPAGHRIRLRRTGSRLDHPPSHGRGRGQRR